MDAPQPTRWVRLTSFLGLYAEAEANLLLMTLASHDITAVRLPVQPISIMVRSDVPGILPIDIMVPADQAGEAREVLAEQPRPSVPEPVRAMVRWYLLLTMMTMVVGGLLTVTRHARESFHSCWPMGLAELAAFVGFLWAGAQLVLALRREGRRLVDRYVIAITLVVGLFGAGLAAILEWGANALHGTHSEWATTMVILLLLLIAVQLPRWLRDRTNTVPEGRS